MRTYAECLAYLFDQLPMFQRQGASALKKDLRNIRVLCAHLGNPQDQFRTLHIAGTNGKGSVSNILSAIGQVAGYKIGLYTSPHYLDFRERIRINGTPIPEDDVVEFVGRVKSLIPGLRPSFFEITVALAFDYFARQEIDFAVVETGLGGRLDSTSVVTPLLSIITNISLDHQQFLGNTLSAIAFEKAGIIKPGIPVLIGERQKEVLPVFETVARERNAPLYVADQIVSGAWTGAVGGLNRKVKLKWKLALDMPRFVETELVGYYQVANVVTAMAATEILRRSGHFNVKKEDIAIALKDIRSLTGIVGRWQVLSRNPLVIGDSAHNEAAMQKILSQILELPGPIALVLGFVKDKSHSDILALLPRDLEYFWCAADLPRSLPATDLCLLGQDVGLEGQAYDSVVKALDQARLSVGPSGSVFVGGSIFVVSEALANEVIR